MNLSSQALAVLRAAYGAEAFNLGVNIGKAAGLIGHISPLGLQPREGNFKIFRNHTGLGSGGHEVCVTRPARQNVHVHMIDDPCAGCLTDIYP